MATQVRPAANKGMQGADRVAAILLTMGKSLSARLMKHFDPAEIKQITRSASELRPVPAPQLGSLIEEFATQFALGASLVSSPGEVARMLAGVLPQEQIDEIMQEMSGAPDRSIWDRISAVNENALTAYLLNEHPQTAAIVVSRIKSAAGAKVLARLPAERRDGIIRRLINMKPVPEETARMLERVLHQEFSADIAAGDGSGKTGRVAEIINKLDTEQINAVLAGLASSRPKAAEALKNQLFTFDDIAGLAPRARSTLFEKVEPNQMVIALKGTPEEYREQILSSLSSRVRKMIEQELTTGPSVSSRKVSEARRAITDLALELAARNEIEIRNDDDEEMVA